MSSVCQINKGVGRPVMFKGLKAQYIWWLGISLVVLMLLFAMLYILGIPVIYCVVLVFGLGAMVFKTVYKLNHRYGEHGLMKKMAANHIPKIIKCDSLF